MNEYDVSGYLIYDVEDEENTDTEYEDTQAELAIDLHREDGGIL